jgi:hypothetical protein
MKNNFTLLLLIFISHKFIAQETNPSVEKNNFNIQIGILGLWINNEFKITKSFALRVETGLDFGTIKNQDTEYDSETSNVLAPVINIEPRWYYNLKKRYAERKRIDKNSGNFLTLRIGYHPNSFVISNNKDINIVPDISFIPKWGIKRNIGETNFNYELGAGLGYGLTYFDYTTKKELAVDLHARLGYSF